MSDSQGGAASAVRLGERAQAERDVLLDVLAIFAHDVNNPLQTLVVLCELAVDENPTDSEARLRAEQCLLAADRLRALAQGMTSLFRGRRLTLRQMCDQLAVLLSRRFDRYGIAATVEIDAIADYIAPPALDVLYASACLSVIAFAAEGSARRLVLHVVGSAQAGTGLLRFGLRLPDADGGRALAFTAAALERGAALVAGVEELAVRSDNGQLLVEFPLRQ
jgi:hypothetical protein